VEEAWNLVESSVIYYQGRPVKTVATQDSEFGSLNYNNDKLHPVIYSLSLGVSDAVKQKLCIVFLLKETLAVNRQRK